MSKNFVSNEDANSLFTKVGERLGLRPKTFTGTHDQWDQLTELQQSEYEYVNFTDDYAAGGGDGWAPHCIIHSDTGSTVTAIKGSKTVNTVETSEGIFECDLPDNDYGEWTFNGEVDGSAMQLTTDINVVQRYEINFINGSTATPLDDITILLQCAGIYDSQISTIQELLANTTSLSRVINSNNAIDYLVRSTTWAASICSDETAMNYIGLNNYASNILINDRGWLNAISSSTYFEYVLNYKNPNMISDTEPYGQVFYNAQYGSLYGYNAFDDPVLDTIWKANNYGTWYTGDYIGYEFPKLVKPCHARLYVYGGGETGGSSNTGVIRGSEDGITWDEISDRFTISKNTTKEYAIDIYASKKYRHLELYMVSGAQYGNTYQGTKNLRFYCREDV